MATRSAQAGDVPAPEAADDVAQVVGEVLERRERAGLGMEVDEVEAPAELLATTMLTHEAIEPALQTAGEVEVGAVDGQDERVVEDGGVEPVGHDQLEAERPALKPLGARRLRARVIPVLMGALSREAT